MEKLTLIDRFTDPTLIQGMTASEKLTASLTVTLLGMGITFVVLCLLWFLISMMAKILNKPAKPVAPAAPAAAPAAAAAAPAAAPAAQDDSALIAVISAAIAAASNVPVSSVIVKKIRRAGGNAWNGVNKQEQLDSRRF